MSSPILEEREILVDTDTMPDESRITWYSPLTRLNEYLSVVMSDHYETTSSAGDWSGWFVQELWGKFYLIIFSQTNNYPRNGYTIYTGKKIAVFDKQPARSRVEDIVCDLSEIYQYD